MLNIVLDEKFCDKILLHLRSPVAYTILIPLNQLVRSSFAACGPVARCSGSWHPVEQL